MKKILFISLLTIIPAVASAQVEKINMGKAMDNLVGTSTGLLTKSATGTYGVQTLPLPVASGGTNQKTANLSLMQKRAAAVANNNLDVNTPSSSATIISTATSWTTTGFTNMIPVSGGWVASFTGNTTAGSNVVTNVSSVSGLVANGNMPVVENVSNAGFPANIPLGAKITEVGTTTITLSKAATATATGITIKAFSDKIKVVGALPGMYNGNFRGTGATVGNGLNPPTARNQAGEPYAIEFMTDAANFQGAGYAVVFEIYGNSGTLQSYRIAVDDVYQTNLEQKFSVIGTNYIQVIFSTTGKHKIRFELSGTPLTLGVWVPTGATIWRPETGNIIKASVFSDSWGQGGSFWGHDAIFTRVCKRLGIECINQSVSGTGYVSTGLVNYNWADSNRKSDTAFVDPNVVFVFGSINDSGAAGETLQANALTLYEGIRTASPNATIFVSGFPATNSISSTTAAEKEAYEYAAFQAFQTWELSNYGFNNSYWIPFSTDSDGAWLNSANVTFSGGGYINYTSFNGTSVSGSNVLTVNSLTSGNLEIGEVLNGSSYFPSGTYVVSYGTGTGQTGTYNMSADATSSDTAAMTAGDGAHPSMTGTAFIADYYYNRILGILKDNVKF